MSFTSILPGGWIDLALKTDDVGSPESTALQTCAVQPITSHNTISREGDLVGLASCAGNREYTDIDTKRRQRAGSINIVVLALQPGGVLRTYGQVTTISV